MAELLEIRDLKVWFPIKKGIFARTSGYVKAVDGVSCMKKKRIHNLTTY